MTPLPAAAMPRGPLVVKLAGSMLVVAAKFVQESSLVCCRFQNLPPQGFAPSCRSPTLALAPLEPQKLQLVVWHPGVLQFVAANPIPPSIGGRLWTRRISGEKLAQLASTRANPAPIPAG